MVMVPNNWSINISKNKGEGWDGKDVYMWFATVELGQGLFERAKERFMVFQDKFPWPEYKVTMSEVTCSGREVLCNDPDA